MGGGVLPVVTLNLNNVFKYLSKHHEPSGLFQKFIWENLCGWVVFIDFDVTMATKMIQDGCHLAIMT